MSEQLLAVIKSVYVETGFVPSMAEAAEKIGMTKGAAISAMFKTLEAEGHIIYSENRKNYLPADWRALITEPVLTKAKRQFNKQLSAEVSKKVESHMDEVRRKSRERVQNWRKNRKGKV